MPANDATNGYAEINNTQMYYEIHGADHPKTLVMIHAGVCDSRMWQTQVDHFAKKYKVITYDMRGFGKSPIGEGTFSFHDDLRALLSYLETDQALLMGCSLGGRTAIDFTLTHPDAVRGLVLVNSAISGYQFKGEPHPLYEAIETAFDKGDLDTVSELEIQIWVDGNGRTPDQVDPEIRNLVVEMNLIPLHVPDESWDLEESLDPPAIGRLANIKQPTLLIMGALDILPSIERTQILEKELPNVRKIVINDTAHFPNMEFPTKFNQMVSEFVMPL